MEFVDFEGMRVDTSFVPLEDWDGCAWVLRDGSVLAVEHTGHFDAARRHSGESNIYSNEFSDKYHALHVGSWIYSVHMPTRAQKAALVTLATNFSRINHCMKDQKWMVLNESDEPSWAV